MGAGVFGEGGHSLHMWQRERIDLLLLTFCVLANLLDYLLSTSESSEEAQQRVRCFCTAVLVMSYAAAGMKEGLGQKEQVCD